MVVRVMKAMRLLTLLDPKGAVVLIATVALGWSPTGPKTREEDGKTPEGSYFICLVKEKGRHGQSLGISYPGPHDADRALLEGRIDIPTHQAICAAHRHRARPPWGSPLGGEIYLHAGGVDTDWTQGCIALEEADMARLFSFRDEITAVEILP